MYKVLLLEPNYQNKYPPMGLMKLATYYRNKGCEVRFFKGDLKIFAATLLCEEFLTTVDSQDIKKNFEEIKRYIITGQYLNFDKNLTDDIFLFETLKDYRRRFKNRLFPKFDIVCVTTLFTFYWNITIETINFAKLFCKNEKKLFVGGIAASIVSKHIEQETGIKPIEGLLDKSGMLGEDDGIIIDELPLDYSILDEIAYKYPVANSYFAYTTRGCIRKCPFCAVPKIEPRYKAFVELKTNIDITKERFGEKKDLILLDNNVLASKCFEAIIDEIKSAGFAKDARYRPPDPYAIAIQNLKANYNPRAMIGVIMRIYDETMALLDDNSQGILYNEREKLNCDSPYTATRDNIIALDKIFRPLYESVIKPQSQVRYVDFNQGLDARLVNEKNMAKLAEVNIRPLRIAFDHWSEHEVYERAVKCAINSGIKHLSNYMLYNFKDKPVELYKRLSMNVEICESYRNEKVSIYSFPMKYHPIDDPEYFRNRNYIGEHWNRKYIRAIQAVMNSTKGKIGPGKSFFEAAFGHDIEEFEKILLMPETFIIYREKHRDNLTAEWWDKLQNLSDTQRIIANEIIKKNIFTDDVIKTVSDAAVREVLLYYQIKR